MISDIVLLKELPEVVLNSIEAYVGCVSGALLKDEYLGLVSEAGFREVKIISESSFPVDAIVNDPLAKTIMENLKITPEEAADLGNSVVSIKFSAVKPDFPR